MIKQSLRPTPLVFRYQASFIATFTLKCSLHIRICNIFYLILQLAKQDLFTLQPLSFYADLQHYLASLDTNFETILLSSTYQRITMVSRELFMLERSTYGNFLLIIREHSISVSPQPPICISFYVNLTFPHSKFFCTFLHSYFRRYNQDTEQSIMMDVFKGVASIAFCL